MAKDAGDWPVSARGSHDASVMGRMQALRVRNGSTFRAMLGTAPATPWRLETADEPSRALRLVMAGSSLRRLGRRGAGADPRRLRRLRPRRPRRRQPRRLRRLAAHRTEAASAPTPAPSAARPAASPSPAPSAPPAAAQTPATPPARAVQTADPFGEQTTLEAKKVVMIKGTANWDAAFETLVDSLQGADRAARQAGHQAGRQCR